MISNQTIVAGIAMLLLNFLLSVSLSANITTTFTDGMLYVQSDKQATEGYRGCDMTSAQKAPAYIFALQTRQGSNNPTCSIGNAGGRWQTMSKQNSNDGSAVFPNLPDGKYRIICLSGEAIGCTINGDTKGLPDQSIVYEKEISDVIYLGDAPSRAITSASSLSGVNQLKVFPNPANQHITIELTNQTLEQEVQIRLINLLGQEVQSLQSTLNKNVPSYEWTLDVSTQEAGTYFVRLTDTKGHSLQQKIIILKSN